MSGNGEIVQDVAAERWEALEGPPLELVEVPAEDGGLDLLIYDEHGALVDASYVPAELVEAGAPGVVELPGRSGDRNQLTGGPSGGSLVLLVGRWTGTEPPP
ncbi:hypothetical protein [Streptomyces sp. KAU_LT]|uniref:hypothetical protein n=1 Tax=Streptomyces sp. KAU_LT TaxID=3046669 RepID=UPI0024B7C9CD|nr:hypothetical protein [Streptomyces sp. KAU_LT]MDI9829704.1 hypothetical protein [Streptomyces sp. KAU_LT]